ncbi:MAG: DUF3604 domain-containing protein [Candidatus Hodarchaeota archaeon]
MVLRIIRITIYGLGVFSIIFFLFDFIGLLIGTLYFGLFKGNWKKHGLLLAFATSISSLLPQRGVADVTGIYPLNLVILSGWGLIFVYFVIFAITKIISRYEFGNEWKSNFRKTLNFQKFPHKYNTFILIILILIPMGIWINVNVNFAVMLDNNPKLLWINAPSTVNENSQFKFIVEAWDRFERLSAVYKGTVEFSLESYNLTTFNPLYSVSAELPLAYTFTGQFFPSDMAYSIHDGKDNGIHVFKMRINTPGIHYILANDSVTQNTYYSNPIIVQNTAEHIYWGDIHNHSFLSDGSGSVAHAYYYARFIAGLEFYALTDHGEIIPFVIYGLSDYLTATENAYEPNTFVTFNGIEYTNHLTGHFNCIFNGDQMPDDPIISANVLGTPLNLWEVLDDFTLSTGDKVLALPHHCVKRRYMQDWSYVNPDYVKIAEVTSVHGDSLFEPNHPLSYRGSTVPPPVNTKGCSIIDALKMGYKLSLYASSDGHDGHPGHSISHTAAHVAHQNPWTTWWTRIDKPYPGGITAVYADNLTRNAVFLSLMERKIFASSDHGRSILRFSINDIDVGEMDSTLIIDNASDPRNIQVFLAQDGAPVSTKRSAASVTPNWKPNWYAKVEIIKNGELLTQILVDSSIAIVTYTDSSPITGVSYGKESCVKIDDEYYINKYSDNPVENPEDLTTGGVDFYLIRVVGENGRHSYIGPIWVTVSQ